MNSFVSTFLERHGVRIPARRAEDYRPLPIGCGFRHAFLPIGVVTSGITDGIQAWVHCEIDHKIYDVHFSNLKLAFGCPSPYKPTKKKVKNENHTPRTKVSKVIVKKPDWDRLLDAIW